MIVAFSPMIRSSTGRIKDTPRNILRDREFVINIISEKIANQVNLCSREVPYGEDEFKLSGLTPLDSERVKPKRIKESLVHLECQFRHRLNYGDKPGCGQIITGEVVKVHIDESVYQDGRILTAKLDPVGRGAGNDWFRCSDVFTMERLNESANSVTGLQAVFKKHFKFQPYKSRNFVQLNQIFIENIRI